MKKIIGLLVFILLTCFLSIRFLHNQIYAQGASFPVSIEVIKPALPKLISPFIWSVNGANLANVNGSSVLEKVFPNLVTVNLAKTLGIKMIRLPAGGCPGDGYNWHTGVSTFFKDGELVSRQYLTVDESLDLVKEMGAEILYQLNVEDSTQTYNPCGQKSEYRGTVPDAVELVTRYKGKIKYYELGNEPWGGRDPNEYVQTALKFARAMKQVDPSIKIGIVGFPGNVFSLPDRQASPADTNWTEAVKNILNEKCGNIDCFDFVTDHPYVLAGYDPWASNISYNFKGSAAYYPPAYYPEIIQRRLNDYGSKDLALTEWNLKCWGTALGPIAGKNILTNPGFENGTSSWIFWQRYPQIGQVNISNSEFHNGSASLKVALERPGNQSSSDIVQESQKFDIGAGKKLTAYIWVKTNKPKFTKFILQQTNPGTHQWHHIAESSLDSIEPDKWQSVKIGGQTFEDTTQVQVVLRTEKNSQDWISDPSGVTAYFDSAQVEDDTGINFRTASIDTVEHGMFIFGSVMAMVEKGVKFANIHNFATMNNGCSFFSSPPVSLKPQGQVFALSSVLAGGTMLNTAVSGPNFSLPLNPSCHIANCMRGGIDLPYVSAYSAQVNDDIYLFIINKNISAAASLKVNFDQNISAVKQMNGVELTKLTASDLTDKSFMYATEIQNFSNPIQLSLPPNSIYRIRLTPSINGDLNNDNKVDIFDYNLLVTDFGKTGAPGFSVADIDKNGKVDIFDYNILVINFGKNQ